MSEERLVVTWDSGAYAVISSSNYRSPSIWREFTNDVVALISQYGAPSKVEIKDSEPAKPKPPTIDAVEFDDLSRRVVALESFIGKSLVGNRVTVPTHMRGTEVVQSISGYCVEARGPWLTIFDDEKRIPVPVHITYFLN